VREFATIIARSYPLSLPQVLPVGGNVIKLSIRALILEETLLEKGFPLKLMTLPCWGERAA